jgi:hypothetical protein
MMSLRTFLAVVVAGLLGSFAFAADAPERQSLEKAIPYAIGLLEAKDYKTFLQAFMQPEDLKEATASTSLDKIAEGFGKRRAPDMLAAFKLTKGLKPALEADGALATYTLPGRGVNGHKEIKFIRIGKNWYIMD